MSCRPRGFPAAGDLTITARAVGGARLPQAIDNTFAVSGT
jgi:hypothetical protein